MNEIAMTPSQQHETDFYRWTRDQAAQLRVLPRSFTRLDVDNLAEEIEDMGRSEIREISSLLRQTLVHLIKSAFDGSAPSVAHWVEEASGFQGDAVLAVSPELRQRLDLLKIWVVARRNAVDALAEHGVQVPALPDECPLTLDQLLDAGFSPRKAAAAVTESAEGRGLDESRNGRR
ncbi:DUF29 domain-containing protein [Aurantimonas sp. MSK8Z-1]|uniref:DUF29 domain-containing protein n=1 Tax=Mangrovibrevibacter kandeliae TaxID=2968473 RepID=UPI002118406C|nr:DUF29 domain-containing protein [Aurantimonas sp. MSK8Z-1]MCW4115366.1 DUF29 domain-containing protein [Aurantimonas sp. MSK8Z-1]